MWAVVKAISSEQWAFRPYPYIWMLPPSSMVRPPPSQKSEIKVYLPLKLIGELESKKRRGNRSRFIANAVREKLARVDSASMEDFSIVALLCFSRDHDSLKPIHRELMQIIIEELNA